MAITRGQMQRQLRRGGGIMDVASGTIGGGNYAGIPMGSRTGFGILKKLKRGVRKIIPNEIADIAVKAAPFVAPFNPALAGAMAGIGSFDQTGSLSGALKRGALTYGGGQAARFIGGAGFQGNPFNQPLISSPLGTETGIGRLFKKSPQIEPISGSDFGQFKETPFGAKDALGGEMLTTGTSTPTVVSEAVATTAKQTTPSITKLIKEGNYTEAAVEAGKKGLKSIFTTPITDAQGNVTGSKLDKTALLASGSFGLTYLDAKKIADEAGVDIGTESEYDEATKEEKKKEYAGYLQNFFGGKKDGGRIGFARGSDLNKSDEIEEFKKLISGDIIENEDPKIDVIENMDDLMAGGGISFSRAEKSFLFRRLGGAGGSDRSYTMPQLYRILSNPNSPSNIGDATILKQIAVVGLGGKKDGGRIELGTGSRPSQLFKLLEEAEAAGDMDKVKEIKSDLFKEFGLKLAMGGEVPVRKNKAGIEELDYRESGGFVPVGVKERADDVPAMLSKNEFVMTADAVRGIGDGDVEKGAQKLYNVMKQAEKVGKA